MEKVSEVIVMKTSEELGVAVREYRQRMGFTQAQFGSLAGISARSVSTMEQGRGNPKLSTLTRIEEVLAVVIQEVLFDDGSRVTLYVRGAWVEKNLFCAVASAFLGSQLDRFADHVQQCYMRMMPNKGQPYLLKYDLERGWWAATVLEFLVRIDGVTSDQIATIAYRHT